MTSQPVFRRVACLKLDPTLFTGTISHRIAWLFGSVFSLTRIHSWRRSLVLAVPIPMAVVPTMRFVNLLTANRKTMSIPLRSEFIRITGSPDLPSLYRTCIGLVSDLTRLALFYHDCPYS